MKIYELIYEVDTPKKVESHSLGYYSYETLLMTNVDTLIQNLINQIDTAKYTYDIAKSKGLVILYVTDKSGFPRRTYFHVFKWVEKELNTIDTENVKLASHMGC